MAALVSHAMRRYPLSPSDGVFSYNLRVDQISSWSQTPPAEEGESSLSRSMRYADPWLHGSVRGAPPGAVVLTPAFVICSCPEYLNGTKKGGSKKGQTVCRKCKGTRVVLPSGNGSTKFGTVRCYPTSASNISPHSITTVSQVRAGTVRVTSSSRPSIIPSTVDPYDLMRRSRLNANSEATSPFRVRSASPSKRNSGSSRTPGRRSILECDINPYELMSTDVEQSSKDSSITFVNGQRIRIRPPAPDPDYEDIEEDSIKKSAANSQEINTQHVNKTSRPRPNRTAPDPPSISPIVINESDQNNRKSILKKTCNTPESNMQGSKVVRPKSGTHFYLPLPNSPRKKVQFLVEKSESDEYSVSSTEHLTETEDVRVQEDYPDVFEEEIVEEESENKVCTLRRSTSERFKVEPLKVVFLDTMALRSKTPRVDSRDAFNTCDLEKLDGITSKRKMSPRPKNPPPLPPVQQAALKSRLEQENLPDVEHDLEDTKQKPSNDLSKTAYAEKAVEQRHSENIQNFTETSTKNSSGQKNLLPKLKKKSVRKLSESSCDSQSEISMLKSYFSSEETNKTSNTLENIESSSMQTSSVAELNKEPSKEAEKCMERTEIKQPQAPPRKRSNNKQPTLNVQICTDEFEKKHESGSPDKICLASTENIFSTLGENVVLLPKWQNNCNQLGAQVGISEQPNQNIHRNIADQNSNMNPIEEKSRVEVVRSTVDETVSIFNERKTIESVKKTLSFEKSILKDNNSIDHPNKTIVQITPTSPVHKIQIRNEFLEQNVQTISVLDNAQRKTSIMINGDDCYSTVNVSDDIPLYQSSVVVGDDVPKSYRRSSSVYITGTFNEESSFDTSINQTSHDVENQNSPRCIYSQSSELNTKEAKEFERHNTDSLATENEHNCLRPSTPDMLRELLRDPVEAVKRNLVPHICGKSDVPRRPRKAKNYYSMLLSSKESTTEILSPRDESNKEPDASPIQLCSFDPLIDDDKDVCSEHSSSTQYEFVDPGSDCYTDHSNRSSVTEEELANRTKFYELLADSALLEISENEDHHYECINRSEPDPIYEEIEIPPPLPSNPPPTSLLDDLKLDKEFTTRSIFEGASKYDILSYLVDAKERGIVPEDSYTFSSLSSDEPRERSPKICHLGSDSSEENSLFISGSLIDEKMFSKSSEVERNDSGVGSETSKSSLSKYRIRPIASASCEDCEAALESLGENDPLLCRKCLKKRSERKEIIMEIVETEEKYSRDLQIILEEFYQPMLVAGLLTPEQLSTIFLNVEELLENSQSLAERLRDAVEIATEQGDEDLLTVNIGKLFLEAAPMLHAFETYCVRQGPASLLLASLEKEKELLRIFLRVSQMENTLLRRMNLNSFLMVPVQRVTKYPLLLARLYKVTSNQNEAREQLKESQHKIELHLNHMNSQTKDVPSKLWRRIGSSGRRPSTEMDLVNIKLRKIAVDVLEWNHEEAKFALEGKLWFTQPTDNNWRKGRTIKLSPVNALLVINGKNSNASKSEREENGLIFPKNSHTREAALLLVRDKNGRYSLLRDPLYLDRCVIATDPAWQSYFEVQELLGKETFIFKAEGEDQTKTWYQQLQFHAQGMGAWRKRRNALANIMMNGMGLRL